MSLGYASDTDANLLTDALLKCGKLYTKEYLVECNGVMGTPGATAEIVLSDGVASDDLYNDKTLYIRDDNDKLCTVNIDDSTATSDSITVDTTSSVLHSAGTGAGSFTAAATYSLYILDTEKFFGYSTQSLDFEEEEVEFLDCNEAVRTDVTKVILGFSGDCKSFSVDKTLSEIFNMSLNGSQSGQVRYEGGFSPKSKTNYQVILKTEKVENDTNSTQVEMFKGNFKPNGAVDFSAAGEYKIIPYQFKALKDTIRDAGTNNGWAVTQIADA